MFNIDVYSFDSAFPFSFPYLNFVLCTKDLKNPRFWAVMMQKTFYTGLDCVLLESPIAVSSSFPSGNG